MLKYKSFKIPLLFQREAKTNKNSEKLIKDIDTRNAV